MSFEADNIEACRRAIRTIKALDYHSKSRYNGAYPRIYKASFLPFAEYTAIEKLKLAEERAIRYEAHSDPATSDQVESDEQLLPQIFQHKPTKAKKVLHSLVTNVWKQERLRPKDRTDHLRSVEEALNFPATLLMIREAQVLHVQNSQSASMHACK